MSKDLSASNMSREGLIWNLMSSIAVAEGKALGDEGVSGIDRGYVLELFHVVRSVIDAR